MGTLKQFVTIKQYTTEKRLATESGRVKIRAFATSRLGVNLTFQKSVSNIRAIQFVLDFHRV